MPLAIGLTAALALPAPLAAGHQAPRAGPLSRLTAARGFTVTIATSGLGGAGAQLQAARSIAILRCGSSWSSPPVVRGCVRGPAARAVTIASSDREGHH